MAFSLLGFCVVATILWTPLGRIALHLAVNKNPGRFDRDLFEAIVAEVRALNLKPGEVHELRLDDLSDPKSLRRLREGDDTFGKGKGSVWAEICWNGKLKVVIQTRDLGHAGSYGFAYSDEPLTPTPFGFGDGDWLELDVPSHLNMVLPKLDFFHFSLRGNPANYRGSQI